MGFDNHFNQDHCYIEDCQDRNTEQIGYNVEITESPNRMEICNTSIQKVRNKATKAHIIIKNEEETQSNRNSGNQQVIYLPFVEVCTEHQDLFLLEDENLVKPGDKFRTHNDFVQYLNENAKRWFFYYKCSDSRKPNTDQESYLYTCVYLRNKEKYVKKGLRKRTNNLKTDCPCKIKLRHLPQEKELTVVFVCNHHDHPLSEEEFYKLQHGRRIPPYVKEEIMDLLTLQVDITKIRKYVQMVTGFNMSRPFFYAIERTMKARNMVRQISQDRVTMLMQRIREVEELLECEDGVTDVRESTFSDSIFDNRIENFNATESKPVIKKTPVKKRKKVFSTLEMKRIRSNDSEGSVNENETLESVRNLQESIKCETQHNPWITDQCVPVLPNRTLKITHINDIDLKGEENRENEDGSIEVIFPGGVESDSDIIKCNVGESSNSTGDGCIAYETVVTEIHNDNDYDDAVISEYVYNENAYDENQINLNSDNDVATNDDTVEYKSDEIVNYVDNGAEIVEYLAVDTNDDDINNIDHLSNNVDDDSNNYSNETLIDNDNDGTDSMEVSAKNVEVQTCDSIKQNALVSVFDVCMKDGHVTGFIVNDELMNQLKHDRADKAVQTEEMNKSEASDVSKDSYIEKTSDGTLITHEYIHRYNIDKYMSQPCFPKYIELLSKKMHIDVLQMFGNVYKEQAMFKMTTTQNGKEGNTRILYVADPPKDIAQNVDKKKREELSKYLNEVQFLKEKVRALEEKNSELETMNKHLMTLK